MVIVGAMAAPRPVVLSPTVTFQSAGLPAAFITSPQLLTSQQVVQQPAFLAQAAVQQEEQEQQQQQQEQEQQEQLFLRDPNNPTADVLLQSAFPFVSQSGVQSPFTLSATPLTRVGLTSSQSAQAQSAQLVAAPQGQSAQLIAAPQQQSAQLVAAQPQTLQFFSAQQPQQQFTAQTLSVAQQPAQQPQVQQQAQQTTATFSFPTFQTATLQQPTTTPPPPPAPAPAPAQVQTTATQFATAPLFLTTAQQPGTLTGFRTVGTPFTFQTVAV